MVIGADLLTAMLKLLDGDTVSIQSEGSSYVRVSNGKTAYNLSVLDAGTYPRLEIPFPEDTVPVTGIPSIAKRTCFAVSISEEEKRPEMRCVHLVFSDDGLHAVGSDGYRIASARGDNKAVGDVDMLIPAASLEKLAQLVTNKDTFKVGTTTSFWAGQNPFSLFSQMLN
jgi:DNA polymerase III sliding clamp (beta) subunit (PCNA family)